MPTHDEANQIIKISLEYLSPNKLIQLYERLDEEIGNKTTNESLKQSLAMMRSLTSQLPIEPANGWFWLALYVLWMVHMALVLGIIASFVILPFIEPWYVALPLNVFIFYFSTSQIDCPLTGLENELRIKLGMQPIKGFVGHYLKGPAFKLLAKHGFIKKKAIEIENKKGGF